MVKCVKCGTENTERNYYCSWCGECLKEKGAGKTKKLKDKFNYLFDLDIVEDDTNDVDHYGSYKSKARGKK